MQVATQDRFQLIFQEYQDQNYLQNNRKNRLHQQNDRHENHMFYHNLLRQSPHLQGNLNSDRFQYFFLQQQQSENNIQGWRVSLYKNLLHCLQMH